MKFILGKKCKQLCRVNQLCKAVCESQISLNLPLRLAWTWNMSWKYHHLHSCRANPPAKEVHWQGLQMLILKRKQFWSYIQFISSKWIPLLALSPKITPGCLSLLQEFSSIYYMPKPVLSFADASGSHSPFPCESSEESPLSRKSTSTGFEFCSCFCFFYSHLRTFFSLLFRERGREQGR